MKIELMIFGIVIKSKNNNIIFIYMYSNSSIDINTKFSYLSNGIICIPISLE